MTCERIYILNGLQCPAPATVSFGGKVYCRRHFEDLLEAKLAKRESELRAEAVPVE